MIVYSLATGGIVSIAALFMAGYIPGILTGISLMIVSGIISVMKNYVKGEKIALKESVIKFLFGAAIFTASPAHRPVGNINNPEMTARLFLRLCRSFFFYFSTHRAPPSGFPRCHFSI